MYTSQISYMVYGLESTWVLSFQTTSSRYDMLTQINWYDPWIDFYGCGSHSFQLSPSLLCATYGIGVSILDIYDMYVNNGWLPKYHCVTYMVSLWLRFPFRVCRFVYSWAPSFNSSSYLVSFSYRFMYALYVSFLPVYASYLVSSKYAIILPLQVYVHIVSKLYNM